ncbi:MAG: prepilin peptidase [Solirubrobacterales bacterium]
MFGIVDWLIAAFVVITGLAAGSFLNVCIDRIPAGRSVVYPPSACDSCGHPLAWADLVPIVSWLWLRGECRYCGQSIGLQAIWVELAAGGLYFLAYLRFGLTFSTVLAIVFFSILLVVSVIDYHLQVIPELVLLSGVILAIPLQIAISWDGFLGSLIAAAGAGSAMYLLYRLVPGGMGFGDVELAAFLGLFLGPRLTGLAVMMGFIIGGAVGVGLLVTRIKGRKDAVPFGPFLAAGGALALLAGPELIRWYLAFWQ